MFNYMLSFEIADFMIGLIIGCLGLFRCGALCSLGYRYITKVLELTFFIYVTNVLLIFQTFLEIGFAIERIQAFSDRTVVRMNFQKQTIIMMTVAVIVTIPNCLMTRCIVPFGVLTETGELLYEVGLSSFAQNQYWTISLFSFAIVRTIVLYIGIFGLNIAVIYKYKQFMHNKVKLVANQQPTDNEATNQNREKELVKARNRVNQEKRIIKILMAMSVNYLIGNTPTALYALVGRQLGNTSFIYNYYSTAAMLIGILAHGSYIFLYASYNSIYKKTLLKVIGVEE